MKKLLVFCVAALLATSCLDTDNNNEPLNIYYKFTKSVTAADGSYFTLDYDDNNNIVSIACSGAEGSTFGNLSYQIAYNDNSIVVRCSDSRQWVLMFNDLYNKSISRVMWRPAEGGSDIQMSEFHYTTDSSGRIPYLTSSKNVDNVTFEVSWSVYCPIASRAVPFGSETYVVTRYDYEESILNLNTNVNLFFLLAPEYTETWELDNVVAMCVSTFGMRSYFLPTAIVTLDSDKMSDDEYKGVSRKLGYEYDEHDVIVRIYEVGDDGRELLYSVEYWEGENAEAETVE